MFNEFKVASGLKVIEDGLHKPHPQSMPNFSTTDAQSIVFFQFKLAGLLLLEFACPEKKTVKCEIDIFLSVRFQGPPGASRGLQGPPGASRGLQGPQRPEPHGQAFQISREI